MLWVEQPVGTGFSTGTPTATSEEGITGDFLKFFKNFEDVFGIGNYKIFITGESYAGRYVPYIANVMLDQNDTFNDNVNGILMYDPCIGSWASQNDITVYPFVEQNNNILNLNRSYLATLGALDESCGYANFREQYMTFPANNSQSPLYENCTRVPSAVPGTACTTQHTVAIYMLQRYETVLQCPLPGDPLGYPTDLQYSYPSQLVYFNHRNVKIAMHAPVAVEWTDYAASSVFLGDGGPQDEGISLPIRSQGVSSCH